VNNALCNGQSDSALADTTGTDDGDQPVEKMLGADRIDDCLSAHDVEKVLRADGIDDRLPAHDVGLRRRPSGRRWGLGRGDSGLIAQRLNGGDEAIPAAGNIDDVADASAAIAKHLSQSGDMDAEIVFLDK